MLKRTTRAVINNVTPQLCFGPDYGNGNRNNSLPGIFYQQF